jgi:type II secretory pathway pseudopilin PulG
MAYTTLADLKTWLGITATTDDDALNDLLAAIESAIDLYCDRHFRAQTKTRYYTEDDLDDSDQILYIFDDDLISVTTLLNGDATTIASTSYWLEPRNDGPPYWKIQLKSSYYWSFITDGWIEVTGSWGYSTTPPAAVVRASLLWAAEMWGKKGAEGVKSHQIGDFSEAFGDPSEWVSYPPDAVRAFLDPLVRLCGYGN